VKSSKGAKGLVKVQSNAESIAVVAICRVTFVAFGRPEEACKVVPRTPVCTAHAGDWLLK
ncbi:MAG: hypothetical protein KAR47_17045, partial [Planctomycetes bacterium]|nr:hypothetical protein [Planctomycetota bacterium]